MGRACIALALAAAHAACSGGGQRREQAKPRVQTTEVCGDLDESLILAESLQGEGLLGRAREIVDDAAANCPNAEVHLVHAKILADLGLAKRARAALESHIAMAGGDARKRVASMLEAIDKLPPLQREVGPEQRARALALYRDGEALRHQGRYDEAIRQLRRSYAVAPHPLTIVQIGAAHMDAKRDVEALKAFARAVAAAEEIAGESAVPVVNESHPQAVRALAVDPARRLVASVGNAGQLKLWEIATGRQIASIQAYENDEEVHAVAFTPSGFVAAVSAATLTVWQPVSGELIAEVELAEEPREGAFTPDGSAYIARAGSGVAVYDAETGAPRQVAIPEVSRVYVSGNDSVVTLTRTAPVRHWGLDGRLRGALKLPRDSDVGWMAAQPGGQMVVVGTARNQTWLFDLDTGNRVGALKQRRDIPRAIAFNPSGTRVAGASRRGVQVWSVPDGALVAEYDADRECDSIVFLDDAQLLVGERPGTIRLRRLGEEEPVRTLEGVGSPVFSIGFDPTGERIAVGSGHAMLWDAAANKMKLLAGETVEFILGIQFSPDGTRIAAGGEGGLRIWDAATGRAIVDGDRDKEVYSLSFHPLGDRILVGGDGAVVVDARTGAPGRRLPNVGSFLAYAPNGEQFAAIDDEGNVTLHDRDGAVRATAAKAHTEPHCAVFSSKGLLATCGKNGAKLWPNGVGKPPVVLDPEGQVWSIAFDPSGERLAIASTDGSVSIWRVAGAVRLRSIPVSKGWVLSVAFHPSGRIVAAGTVEGRTVLLDAATGDEIISLHSTPSGRWIAISPAGLVEASEDGDDLLYWRIGRFRLPGFVAFQRAEEPGLLRELLREAAAPKHERKDRKQKRE